ncbi:General transcription factor IIIC, polypeptide 3 [Desmophyllum pertusum]|uniref:General transcription factor IIIC, polypeptide 3 n=1 Tax=Desmophyllum pertusum TaxID=174260 RepID=A0A9X0CE97_9CNID|nr:General transcription factor IIIC, polypeptide 3 [Desmophyllum pertusum]
MGRANILWARGEIEQARGICMELIRQVPKCSEPFQTLGMMYEEQGDQDKALQFFLIAAYLSKSGDVEEWVKLAMMSLEQNNFGQALTCYNQALKLDHTNVNILWDRAALCYQMEDTKKAQEYYEAALKAVPVDDGAKLIDLSCDMAKFYHENNAVEKAIKVLQAAFSKHPDHVNNQAINMLADIHMTSKAYDLALEMILKYCDVKKEEDITDRSEESSPSRPLNSASSPELDSGVTRVKWILPDDLPIDLRIKIAVCLIHVRQLHVVKEILAPLYYEPVEGVGDLYIDVAEAYAENGDCEEALEILDMLIETENYCLAGVWLKKGECLNSLGRSEEAALAYAQVVSLAPNHLDARLILASLHQQLGRPNQALDVLSDHRGREGTGDSNEDDEVAMDTSSVHSEGSGMEPAVQPQDFRLLFHKCALLHSQNRIDEFLEAGIEMFRLFFIDVYYSKDLTEMALKSSRHKREIKKSEALEQEESRSRASIAASSRGDTGLRIEEWWEMLKNVVSTLSGLKRHSEACHMVLCALSSDRFSDLYQTELIFMGIVALYLNREYKIAFDASKILIARDRQNPVLWNLLSRITAKSGDSRHQRYVLRLLIKNPDEFPLLMYSGHNALVSGSYRFAVGEYVRAFRQAPHDPLVTLCLGLQYIHLASQHFPRNRHSCVVQYLGIRGECQEAFYNIGRAFHQLGLLQFAVHYYNKALEFPLYETSKPDGEKTDKFSEKRDLHRETAFNLSLIYRASGNEIMAKELLMTHCWV